MSRNLIDDLGGPKPAPAHTAAPAAEGPQDTRERQPAVDRSMDAEVRLISRLYRELSSLNPDCRRRVMGYLSSRVDSDWMDSVGPKEARP